MDILKGQKVLKRQDSENHECEFVVGYDKPLLETKCLLCNEKVVVSLTDQHIQVCERCKQAWLKMREFIEKSPKYATGGFVGKETIESAYNYLNDYTEDYRALSNIETKEKELLAALEKTEEGKVIAQGYKDFFHLKKEDKN